MSVFEQLGAPRSVDGHCSVKRSFDALESMLPVARSFDERADLFSSATERISPCLIREVFQRRFVTILVYHRVDPVTADRHFTALRRSYSPISLQAYLEARRDNACQRLPSKALIVTIDDGHESVYRLKPILAKHQMPVTVFLCSGFVGTNRRFWFSRLRPRPNAAPASVELHP